MKKITIVALVALVLLLTLPAIVTAAETVEIRGEVYTDSDVTVGTLDGNVPTALTPSAGAIVGWDAYNFAGFWYDLKNDQFSEQLEITNDATGDESLTGVGKERTIVKGELLYTAKRQPQRYKVGSEENLSVDYGMPCDDAGGDADGICDAIELKSAASIGDGGGQYYAIVGWQAKKYIAVKGKANKLTELVKEDAKTDKKTLTVGESWDIGGGWSLSINSIDARASPRQAWVTLSKDNVKVDEKVLTQETASDKLQSRVYTYVTNVGGETNVPVFVTYLDSVFSGATTDMVQLKYTWAISTAVTEIKSGDKYSKMKVSTADSDQVILKSDDDITLTQDTTTEVMKGLNLKVAENTPQTENRLAFYPASEVTLGGGPTETTPTIGTPVPTTPVKPGNVTNTTVAPTAPGGEGATPTATTPVKPTPTQTEPGFEAAFAIAGLLAVAFLVLRQRK